MFDRAQAIRAGRVFARPQKHALLFRRMIRCALCGYSLIGETRKGHIYYRCHSQTCHGTTLREPDIERAVCERLALLAFDEEEMRDVRDLAAEIMEDEGLVREERLTALHRDLGKCEERLARLRPTARCAIGFTLSAPGTKGRPS